MTPDQLKCIQLRDCFYAGYSMPQYCADRNIKNPMIASYDSEFLWELYVQFRYAKRNVPKFCLLKGEGTKISHSVFCVIGGVRFDSIVFSEVDSYDRIIMLTTNKFAQLPAKKTIYFDVLLKEIIQYVYCERPLYHFINSHRGVKVIVTDFPVLKNNELTTAYEKKILKKNIHQHRAMLESRNGEKIESRFDILGYTNEEAYAMLSMSGAITRLDGSTCLLDNEDSLIKIKDGRRLTAYQNGKYRNTIYCIGTCIFYGICAPYDKTIESYLQKIINEDGHEYLVENASQFYAGRYQDIFYNLDRLPVKSGDIILICIQGLRAEGIPFFSSRNIFDRPHNYGEVFIDKSHLNENGNRIYAMKFYKYLKENDFFRNYNYENIPASFSQIKNYGFTHHSILAGALPAGCEAELEEYKAQLRQVRPAIGAIVMNCNPFTLGHLHLVEYASKRVERLYIFVVEEDKSFFPFADRIELVKSGTAHLNNVTVLPSGRFIISQLTFSGYFNKSELQDTVVDPSMDVEIFAKEIAPQLGITVRFAGDEPIDRVTRQYNEVMQRILPLYHIDFEVIPRKEYGGGAISASRVRKLLSENNFEEIKRIVPSTTFDYLKNKERTNENFISSRFMQDGIGEKHSSVL